MVKDSYNINDFSSSNGYAIAPNTETTVVLTKELINEVKRISETEGNLTADDEKRLIEIYKLSGATRLGADVMYLKHYDSIEKICKQFAHKHKTKHKLEDYIQDAYISMIEALDTFKFSRNVRFNTYLSVILKKNMNDDFYKENGLSKYYQQEYYKIGCFISDFEKAVGRCPSDEEIMDGLSYTRSRYESILREAASLNPIYFEGISEAIENEIDDKEDRLSEDTLLMNVSLHIDSPEAYIISEELTKAIAKLLEDLGSEKADLLLRKAGVGFDKPQSRIKIATDTGNSLKSVRKNLLLTIDYARDQLTPYFL